MRVYPLTTRMTLRIRQQWSSHSSSIFGTIWMLTPTLDFFCGFIQHWHGSSHSWFSCLCSQKLFLTRTWSFHLYWVQLSSAALYCGTSVWTLLKICALVGKHEWYFDVPLSERCFNWLVRQRRGLLLESVLQSCLSRSRLQSMCATLASWICGVVSCSFFSWLGCLYMSREIHPSSYQCHSWWC